MNITALPTPQWPRSMPPASSTRTTARGFSGSGATDCARWSTRSGSRCSPMAGSSTSSPGPGPPRPDAPSWSSTPSTSCAAWPRGSPHPTETWSSTTACSPAAPATGRSSRRPPSHWAVPEAQGTGPDTTKGPANQEQERAELPPQVLQRSLARPAPPKHTPWASLLCRIFDVDARSCPRCLSPMVVLAFLTDPGVLERILGHLGLPTTPPPVAPPRLPSDDDLVLALDGEPSDQVGGEVAPSARRHTRSPPPDPVSTQRHFPGRLTRVRSGPRSGGRLEGGGRTRSSLEATPADRRPAAKALGDVIPAQTLIARVRCRGATSPPASRFPHPGSKSRPRSGDSAATAPSSAQPLADGSCRPLLGDAEGCRGLPGTPHANPGPPTARQASLARLASPASLACDTGTLDS